MAVISAEKIVDLVDPIEIATQGRRSRMDIDRKLLRLDEYDINTDSNGLPAGTDYRSFTGNEPMAFYRKVSSVVSDAELLAQVPYGIAQEQERDRYDLAERFYYGMIDSANENLRKKVELELQDQLAGMVPIRGWGIVLSLLRNRDDGTSFVDMQVWDPRNCYWQVGPDGLEWVCYKLSRSVRQVKAEYPDVTLDGKNEDDIVDVYNFFDKQHNTVITPGETPLKKSTEHGAPGVPIIIAPVGPMPRIWDEMNIDGEDNETDTDYGESIFAPNRKLFSTLNELFSILLELAAKQLNQTYVMNDDEEGNDLEESPNASDAVVHIGKDAKLTPLTPIQSTRDLLVLVEHVMGMVQRGALPHVSYGQLAINISGFAVTQLNKQFVTVLGPTTKTIESLILDALIMLADQFVSGRFNPITLRGLGNNRDFMQVTFLPEMMMGLPPPMVQLIAELPEDDVARMSMAQQAGADTGTGPTLPKRYIHEKILKLPDAGLIQRMLDEERARFLSPQAASFTLARSSFRDGNMELGRIYLKELQIQQLVQELELLKIGIQPQNGQNGGNGQAALPSGQANAPSPPGIEPEVLPFIMQNGGPAPFPRNAGPNQFPGTPRPGAQTSEPRLGTLGALRG